MTLKTVEFPFVTGADESRDAKVLPVPRLKRAENLRTDQTGMLRKCYGTVALAANAVDSESPTPVGPVRVFNHDGQLCACGERAIWTYSPEADQLEELEDITTVTLAQRRSLGHYGAADVVARGAASVSAFTVYAWVTFDGTDYQLHVLTLDNQTGSGSAGTAVTVSTSTSAGLKSLRVIAINSAKVTVFWGETVGGSATHIRYLDVTSANSGPYDGVQGTSLVSDADQTDPQWFDVTPHDTGYLLAYFNGTSVTTTRYDASHASQASANITFTGSSPRVQVCGDFTDLTAIGAVVIMSSSNVKCARFSAAIAVQGTPYDTAYSAPFDTISTLNGIAACTYLRADSPNPSDDSVAIVVNAADAGGDNFCRVYIIRNDASSNTSAPAPDTYCVGKPALYSEDILVPVRYWTSQTNSYEGIIRFDPGYDLSRSGFPYMRPEIRVASSRAVPTMPDDIAATVAYDGSSLKVPLPLVDRWSAPDLLADPTGEAAFSDDPDSPSVGSQTITVIGCDAYEFEVAARDRFMTARVGGYTYLGGGTVMSFDGKRVTEMGFWSFPDVRAADIAIASTGGSLTDGTYTWAFLWEWVDYQGKVHRSAPKLAQKVIAEGTGTATATITLPLSFCQTFKHWRLHGGDDRPVVLVIYATEADGTLARRLEGTGVTSFPENNPVAFTVSSIGSYVDSYDRDTIQLTSRDILYATSFGASELENVPPPPSRFIAAHDGRLFGINDEDPTQVWYSKLAFPAVAPAWNEALVIQFEEPVKALASQDGNLIAFTERGVYTVVGRGADNTGGSTTYEPPQLLSGERGCVNPRSVVSTPAGLFFESQRGIEVLPRGGAAPSFIGDPMRETLSTYPVITDAYHAELDSEVLFSCVTAETVAGTGRILAYDYRNQQWFVRTRGGNPVASMSHLSNRVVYAIYDSASSMTLWKDDDGFDEGDASYIPWVIQTGDIRLGGMMRSQRVNDLFLLGRAFGAETLRLRESYDSGNSWSGYETIVFTAAKDPLELWYPVQQTKAQSHMIELSSAVYSSTVDSEGVGLNGFTIHGAPLRGRPSLAQSQEI